MIRGGGKLNARLGGLADKLRAGKMLTVKAGFLEDATYEDGTKVAMVAAIQNYGAASKGIPPRPFFSSTVADKGPAWPEQLGAILKHNDYDAPKSLGQMGEVMVGQIEQAIVDLQSPALSPVTIERRTAKARKAGRKINQATASKPLVDTGHMLGSVDKEVFEK